MDTFYWRLPRYPVVKDPGCYPVYGLLRLRVVVVVTFALNLVPVTLDGLAPLRYHTTVARCPLTGWLVLLFVVPIWTVVPGWLYNDLI